MEQNLSEKERRQRLAAGALTGTGSLAAYLHSGMSTAVPVLGFISIGFIANYFTCFCGTKRAIKAVKKRL